MRNESAEVFCFLSDTQPYQLIKLVKVINVSTLLLGLCIFNTKASKRRFMSLRILIRSAFPRMVMTETVKSTTKFSGFK